MRNLPWNKFLSGPHHDEIMTAHHKEFSGLALTIPHNFLTGDAEYAAAKQGTNCRLILEFKRVGGWELRLVIQGFHEDCLALDGADLKYSPDVAGLTAIRNVILDPIPSKADDTLRGVNLSNNKAART